MNKVILRLDDVIQDYGSGSSQNRAVDRVSLDVYSGEFLTLLGASGSGKSTILMMIAGFADPTAGDIYIDGQSVLGVPPHRRRIGVVFQNYALFPHLTVKDNLAFGPRNARLPEAEIKSRVEELLELVQLEDLAHRLPSQLSGGQQQRVAIARALARRPEILLLDEPLAALDKHLREHMVLELQALHKRLKTTMVYVTHDQEEAMVMSSRIAIMDKGRIASVGAPEDLYDKPPSGFVAEFLGRSNILNGGGPRHALRPERIVIGEAPEGWETLRGTIMDAFFLGDRIRYNVDTGQGGTLVVVATRRHGRPLPQVGEEVSLAWHPSDASPIDA